jgi:hypothetical protein
MYNPSTDHLFYETGVSELQDYLLSENLYWRLSPKKGGELPMLTVGGLLLARRRLQAAPHLRLDSLDFTLHTLRSKWRSAWERKVRHETRARTELWHNFLADYRHAPDQHADAYPQQVRWRVIIHLLLQELEGLPAEAEALTELDRILRLSFIPGRFIWDPELAPSFERDPVWYLYGNLKP